MRRPTILRQAALLALAFTAGSTGCTHNYYYGTYVPAYAAPGQYGEVCEVPSQVSGGTVMAQAPGTTVLAAAPGTRVLVSEPQGITPIFRGPRIVWRKPDPESLVTTRVEGGIDDASVTR
jgi:hypothetical protein